MDILDAEHRPHLTFNHIFPTVNLISGIQRQNKQDIKVFPKKGGMKELADVLTAAAKNVTDESNGEYLTSMAFFDGLVTAKGWLGLDITYDDEPVNGEIVMERYSPFSIIEDPNCENYDLNTSKYIIRTFWWDKEAIRLAYPKVKELNIGLDAIAQSEPDDVQTISFETDTYQDATDDETKNPNKIRYKIRKYFWRTYERRSFLINKASLEVQLINKSRMDEVAAIMKSKLGSGWTIQERIIPILHRTTMVGELELEHEDNPYGEEISAYPIKRFCPYWIDGDPLGAVDNLKDPQRELNKRYSQLLHHLNHSANSGFIGPEGWEVETKEEVAAFASKPGANIHYKLNKKPERIVPTTLSSGHLAASQYGAANIKIISGVNADLRAEDTSRSDSGIAMQERKAQGALVSEIIFDNFRYTQQMFNETLVDFIRKSGSLTDIEIKDIAINAGVPEFDIELLKHRAAGKYGIKVSQSQHSPTTRLSNFSMLLEAAKAGMPIPMDVLLEMSDIPNKKEIIARIQQQQQEEKQREDIKIQSQANAMNAKAAQAQNQGGPQPGGQSPGA